MSKSYWYQLGKSHAECRMMAPPKFSEDARLYFMGWLSVQTIVCFF